jgi:hypothetical protein
VTDSWKGFGDQYLLLEARPIGEAETPGFRVEEDLAQLGDRVHAFARDVRDVVADWQRRFRDWHAAGRKTAVWGAGSKGVSFLTTLGLHDEVHIAVDINPHKQGYFMPGTGHEVVSPERLVETGADVVVVMNPIYVDEIREQLAGLGLAPEIVAA